MKAFTLFTIIPLLLGVLYAAGSYWLARKSYILDGATVADATRAVVADATLTSVDAKLEAVSTNLLQHIAKAGAHGVHDAPWLFITAGGWMGAFKLLYASTSEYVLLFGTAMDTSGHSGRYWAHIEDTLVAGNFTQWPEGSTRALHWGAGDTVVHPRWAATGVHWRADTWMVEYARGAIVTTLPFAFGDGLLSSQDWLSIARALWLYARVVLANLARGVL